ncbi:MAG: hypothetical protein CM1200mP10_03510 [Candidatus Neomarinimicrobiota bacterium]|nr:MAG: hypothetical protein CM1200mP10_03510 [Candidatus Neomarinimicrobiota bacterium]
MPISANVTIIIRDILGREISRLGNKVYSPGLHSFGWDGKIIQEIMYHLVFSFMKLLLQRLVQEISSTVQQIK